MNRYHGRLKQFEDTKAGDSEALRVLQKKYEDLKARYKAKDDKYKESEKKNATLTKKVTANESQIEEIYKELDTIYTCNSDLS